MRFAWAIRRRSTRSAIRASSTTGFKQKVAGFKAIFPTCRRSCTTSSPVAIPSPPRWVVTGSQQRDYLGIHASGQTIRVEGMNFYRLADGRVTDIWTQFDGVALMQQLGSIPD